MIVNQANLEAIYQGFQVIFNEAFQGATALWEKVATMVPSATKQEAYKWLGKLPRMREWIGPRVIQNIGAYTWTIVNKSWEATVGVDREDVEDDTIGVYKPIITGLAQSAATHPDEYIFALLLGGFTALCYDGQYFFDIDHNEGDSGDQVNKGTAALAAASYGAARAAMMALKDDKGNLLNIMPNLLVVPPQLEETARTILNADVIIGDGTAGGSKTNVWKNSADLLVVPLLASQAAYWFLLDTTKPIKPLIYQQRKAAEFVSKDNPNDDNVFFNKEFVYGVDCRDNVGYGLWQLAYGSDGTT